MADPVGKGERKHPGIGNALLTTIDQHGNQVRTPLWIEQFATDLNLQIDSAQLRAGLSHRPIRVQERFLIFSTLWNVIDRPKYLDLVKRIKNHWVFSLNQGLPTPMKLDYYGANKRWMGFIENANVGYAVTDVVLRYQFQMRTIPSGTTTFSHVGGGRAPFVPTAAYVKHWGDNWYTQNQFYAEVIGEGNESRHGAQVPGKTKKDHSDAFGRRKP